MEFHISRSLREQLDTDELLFSYTGNVVFSNVAASRKLAQRLNDLRGPAADPAGTVNAGALFAMGLIDELSHAMVARYRKEIDPQVLGDALRWFEAKMGKEEVQRLLLAFTAKFPNVAVYRGQMSPAEWLGDTKEGLPNREAAVEELVMLWLANINTAFAPFSSLFEDRSLQRETIYKGVTSAFPDYFVTRPQMAPAIGSLLDALIAPMLASPGSLTGQLDFIREHWAKYLGDDLKRVILAMDVLKEEDVAIWMRFHPPSAARPGPGEPGWQAQGFVGDEYVGFDEEAGEFVTGPDGIRRRRVYAADHQAPLNEYEAFSPDQAWMPTVVMLAKSTYVWLEQLSKKYGRHIHRLDQIPDEELQLMASRGMTALWLIGLWERSTASRTIKRLRGQSDAVASAYSLREYRIAEDLGGDSGYQTLRDRAATFGIRLASDMVPNHMGIDSTWVVDHPDWFISRSECPFPVYRFEGPDLSTDSRVEIKIDDHYYDQTDAAVVFRLRQRRDGETRYVYHGNDGTTFAWNDTAQLDYSRAEVREQIMQTILHVARLFPIIRFDAAMTLAKRHVQRLWFPLPGVGGSIPSRAESAMSQEQFDELMPNEFWREVVDRVAVEVPGTLLLAEAFWLLESYFVRTLGMHRVYNSAFMNMLRDEENAKYRSYLKKTIEFDPDIMKRYVNFMSNPDERTAVDQFGTGDKFFGACTLLATLPGLPMFAHGQIEGFTERYGMDFKQARLDENPDQGLMARHQHEIAPLLKNRKLFAESTNFVLYDFWADHGKVDENVFAYSNRFGEERALILYNNSYGSTRGTIHLSAASVDKSTGSLIQRTVVEGLGIWPDESVILSYRDTAHNLEYLRRSSDLDRNGLSLDLRGYGYVVLQNWRERRSSIEQPWDRLCESLHGTGVYNLEEALTRLRFGSLHEALREAVSVRHVQAFAEVALKLVERSSEEPRHEPGDIRGKSRSSVSKADAKIAAQEQSMSDRQAGHLPKAPEEKKIAREAIEDGSIARSSAIDPAFEIFVQKSDYFFARVIDSLPSSHEFLLRGQSSKDDGSTDDGAQGRTLSSAYRETLEALTAAAVQLPSLAIDLSTAWPLEVREIFPTDEAPGRIERIWAPIVAWLVLQSLPAKDGKAVLFDQLQLRPALAEIFSSVGLEGEDTWRAAARVRSLLLGGAPSQATGTHAAKPDVGNGSRAFWNDPDVRWLVGMSEAGGITYLNKERFEEFFSWLQLPTLIQLAGQQKAGLHSIRDLESNISRAFLAAGDAGYRLEAYLDAVGADEGEPAGEPRDFDSNPIVPPEELDQAESSTANEVESTRS